jgi:hypothetical protein
MFKCRGSHQFVELNIEGLADLISKNPIDSAIYEFIIYESDITFNSHVSDCLFL